MRKNFHRLNNPEKEAQDFIAKNISRYKKFFWDKLAFGIVLCAGADYENDALYHPERYFEVKNDEDLKEVFRNFEDGE